ncbi:unnamed protein product [Lactuca saligna]|uniref:Uncharacterized protein n=1 Tax=Lactuca saligna TaxID=75948 RepID=A0AA36E837_LACSI|nr:unnamed protein product [Lactuca saligna]
MATQSSTIFSEADFKLVGDAYGLSPNEGVEFPSPDLLMLSPPPGKVGVYLKTLDAGMCLPRHFQEVILQKNGCSIQILTPIAINKVLVFETICRDNVMLLDY